MKTECLLAKDRPLVGEGHRRAKVGRPASVYGNRDILLQNVTHYDRRESGLDFS